MGTVTTTDTTVTVTNANAVTVYISVATSFNNYHDVKVVMKMKGPPLTFLKAAAKHFQKC